MFKQVWLQHVVEPSLTVTEQQMTSIGPHYLPKIMCKKPKPTHKHWPQILD